MALTLNNYQNDLLLRALNKQKTERSPVWIMRQAGRILPEYLEVRNSVSGFRELVETPDLVAEVTTQPVDIIGVDAAIIFSDILVIPDALGLPYEMVEKKGPHFPETIKSRADIARLRVPDANQWHYVVEGIQKTKKKLNGKVPLIGFAGAPFTIFCYMVEGGGSKTFSKPRAMMYAQPELAHLLLDKITDATIQYLKDQVEAGADVIQLFDSWAGILSLQTYEEFALPYVRKIFEALGTKVPRIFFAKGAFFMLESFKNLPCEAIGLDWSMNIGEAIVQVGKEKVFQGNLDPAVLYGDETTIINATREMLSQFNGVHHVANLGHGVYPDTDKDKVKLFVDTIKNSAQ